MPAAPIVAAVAGSAASIYSANQAARAQKRAGKKARRATEAARTADVEARQPYVDAGKKALASLEALTAAGPGGPMYEWRRAQEEDAMEKRLRAGGMYRSGRMTQLMSDIGQRLTAEETEAHNARLMSLAQMGQGGVGAGSVDTQGYYAEGAASAAPWQQVGQSISTISGTVADAAEEERKRREWEAYKRRSDASRDTAWV